MSSVDYEKKNNPLLIALGQERFNKGLNSLKDENAWILLPTSIALEGLTIDNDFITTHIISVDPSHSSHFVSYNGILGLFEQPLLQSTEDPPKRLLIISLPSRLQGHPSKLFTAPLFGVEKDLNIAKDSRANLVQAISSVEIQGVLCNFLLVSDPILYEGCAWRDVYQYRRKQRMSSEPEETPKAINKNRLHERTQSMANLTTSTPKKNLFLQRVNHPTAVGIASNIKFFISSMNSLPTATLITKDGDLVRKFLDQTEETIRGHPLWKDCDDKEMAETIEGLEKFVTVNLHARLFGNREEERKKDTEIINKLKKLNWITLKHMEVHESVGEDKSSITLACTELKKMNKFKTPRDKLVCIRNCSKVIYKLLSTGGEGSKSGADDFLPVLIIILIHANPPNLQSNIQYIRRFRHPSRLLEEAGYYLTQLESAVHFLLNVKAQFLKLSEEEFELYMTGNHPDQNTSTSSPPAASTIPSSSNIPSSKDIVNNTLTEDTEESNTNTGLSIQDIQDSLLNEEDLESYKFLDATVDTLTISNVSELLELYKKTVRQNALLKKLMLNSETPLPYPQSSAITRLDLAQSYDSLRSDDIEQATEIDYRPKSRRTRTTSQI